MSDGTPLLGPLGIWSRELRYCDPAEATAAAVELERLGFDALWIPDVGGPVFEAVERLLSATTDVVVATGILNVWMHAPEDVAAAQERVQRLFPDRFLLGLGIGHAPVVNDGHPGRYTRPLSTMRDYLDALDAASAPDAPPARVLAALAPKMMALATERSQGIHPYLMPVEHTRIVRSALADGQILAQELSVLLGDPLECRRVARRDLGAYFALPNYTNTWKRLGFSDADLADGGSDRLVDALYACGTIADIAERIGEYREAGADHVCLRAVYSGPERLPLAEWRALAALLEQAPARSPTTH